MKLHLKSNEGEEGITRSLPGHDLHGLGSSSEFLVKSFDNVGGSQGDPLFLGEIEEVQARVHGFLQAFNCRRDLGFPS